MILYEKRSSEKKHKDFILNSIQMYEDFSKYIYSRFPIFQEWLEESKIIELRKNLYPKHIYLAKLMNLNPITEENQEKYEKNQTLISIDSGNHYFFYNVPKEYRFLHQDFIFILNEIGERLNKKINYTQKNVRVKYSISSALRTLEYQTQLKGKNRNAIENSTHSYGISFDIFYDEFWISLNVPCNDIDKEICKKVKKTGLLVGGYLRRQLQSILAETLLELQKEKLLYVILEKNQRVFHITAIPDKIRDKIKD